MQPEASYLVKKTEFTPALYLANAGFGRTRARYKADQVIFSQGAIADFVSYVHSGRAKLTVVSNRGKEATVTLIGAGDFIGEEALCSGLEHRTATATAITACVTTRISKEEMGRVLHEEHSFADFFLKFVLFRSKRTQADLIDQLFNSSERRLARTLLLLAEYGSAGEPGALIPRITQECLADMIGTTRSRVSFFMNRFRRLGYIEYKNRIRVNKSLLNVVLRDQLPEENASRPKVIAIQPTRSKRTKRSGLSKKV